MRALALLLAAGLLAAAPADARRHKRPVKMAKIKRGKALAPASWWVAPAPVAPGPALVAAETPAPAVTPAPTGTPAPTPGSEVPVDNPHSVSVRSTEFRFSLSQPAVDAGEVKVQFDNSRAEDPHALGYRGPTAAAFDQVAPGAVVKYTVALSTGTYTLYCPLPEHEGLGMKATLTVR